MKEKLTDYLNFSHIFSPVAIFIQIILWESPGKKAAYIKKTSYFLVAKNQIGFGNRKPLLGFDSSLRIHPLIVNYVVLTCSRSLPNNTLSIVPINLNLPIPQWKIPFYSGWSHSPRKKKHHSHLLKPQNQERQKIFLLIHKEDETLWKSSGLDTLSKLESFSVGSAIGTDGRDFKTTVKLGKGRGAS